MSHVHIFLILVEDELIAFFVDGVVGQVHANVFHVLLVGHHVLFCCETSQPVPKDVDPQRIHTSNQHVYPQIELQTVDQVRPTQIPLNYAVLSRIYILKLSCQKYAFSLRQRLRFDDVGSGLAFGFVVVVGFELLIVSREVPGEGKEVEVFWTFLSHSHKVFSQQVFSGEGVHAWEVVYFLVVFHFHEYFGSDLPVSPP